MPLDTLPKIVRYVVTVKGPGDDDRLQHEQQFRCCDFPDAEQRARRHAARMEKTFPDCSVNVIECPLMESPYECEKCGGKKAHSRLSGLFCPTCRER
jgi:hypothetical protein